MDEVQEKPVQQDSREVLKATIQGMIEEMGKIQVDSQDKYDFLAGWVKRNKDTQKLVAEAFEADRVAKKAAYDAVLEEKGKLLKPLEQSEKVVRDRMTAWSTEQERKRREEVKRLEDEERKKKEDDRLVEAQNLSSMGRQDAADAVLDKKVTVSRAAISAAAPAKVGKTMEKWVVTVENKAAFLAEAAMFSEEITACVDLNLSQLAQVFKRNGTKSFPGLKVDVQYVPVI